MSFSKLSKNHISNLSELVISLQRGEYENVLSQTEQIDIPIEDLLPYINWKAERYTRNCVARDEYFELILLCWEKGQKTAIHCHDEQECWVKVIFGSFAEVIYTHDEEAGEMEYESSEVLSENEVTSIIESKFFHSLENVNSGRSMSLHLYMRPIAKCRVYNKQTKQLEMKELSYDSLSGKRL
ncbi:MAG: hypothetical protein COA58_01165 [Bacteroidetes bacterium]|nr:MAG: hypothetical protein COA58_01165 [Bacteroidota bacterium]